MNESVTESEGSVRENTRLESLTSRQVKGLARVSLKDLTQSSESLKGRHRETKHSGRALGIKISRVYLRFQARFRDSEEEVQEVPSQSRVTVVLVQLIPAGIFCGPEKVQEKSSIDSCHIWVRSYTLTRGKFAKAIFDATSKNYCGLTQPPSVLETVFTKSPSQEFAVLLAKKASRPFRCLKCSHSGAEERLETPSAKNLTDIGIRRIFSSEHDIFRESVRKFFQEEVIPHHAEWEKAGEVSRELWEKAGKQGLLGVNITENHGGIGGDLYSAAVVWEEQAYSNCTGPGFSLHSDIVMPYIANYGSEEQIKRFIPQMTAGKCIGAIAMTEPGAGSDLQGVRTNAKKDGSDWILNGSKVFITNGWLSDVVIVVAVTSREARSPAHGISLFLVENGMKGFIKGRKLHKMGLKAQDTAELFFEDVRLPASALLGEENKGFYYLMQELPQERLLIAELAISACEFMFEETRNYVKQRKAFGKTVAHIQTVQHKLAELKTHICVTRAFVDSCLQLHAAKRLDSASASMAKYWASELQNSVAYDCVQLHGGWGYMWEYPIAKSYVDARVQPIYGGTNEIMKELIARDIVRP
ncbi:PREDICTED: long-chain specific acyl-CoA dehydrogenase, mitochondrial [Condylura cristata]|uniref:long-chain specific acyl-CoA dehydrogenase, mitochondrial n=1 Tax=Condylura cristata TaxID=143302 RepID=UPI0003346A1F|nr:PREDICTED: long-chain specific acyl-CoA dehydrogenase, mitochondrial [Condylura cristata]